MGLSLMARSVIMERIKTWLDAISIAMLIWLIIFFIVMAVCSWTQSF